jgi:hypothetical protein
MPIRYADIHRVSSYISKYLTDELLFSAPAGTRRITCSRSIQLLSKPPKTHSWRLHKTTIFYLYERLLVVSENPEFDSEKWLKGFSVNVRRQGELHE